jgi:hypothetical protein
MKFPLGTTQLQDQVEVFTSLHELAAMKVAGHAVQLSQTYDHNNKFLSAYVAHFRTCEACAENQRKEANKNGQVDSIQK